MLVDTHIHLDAAEFLPDREHQLCAARTAGVTAFVVPAVSAPLFPALRSLADRYADWFPAYGIHPLYVQQAAPDALMQVADYIAQPNTIAVGEIGLDYFVPDYDPALQVHFFTAQLRLARQHDLPVILHVRRAVDDVLKYIRRIPVAGGIAHAFNGSPQQAEMFIRLGFKLGFGGAMTYEGSKRIRQLAATLPLEALVLETDAPDMPPAWDAGKRNTPVNLLRIAQVLADLRGIPLREIIETTGRNAQAVLPRLAIAREPVGRAQSDRQYPF